MGVLVGILKRYLLGLALSDILTKLKLNYVLIESIQHFMK